MRVKVSELAGVALDWAVNKAEGRSRLLGCYSPSTDWATGGPIIERERINLMHAQPGSINTSMGIGCTATVNDAYFDGPTPLIAAMRCYVTSKLGDEVDVPEELLE